MEKIMNCIVCGQGMKEIYSPLSTVLTHANKSIGTLIEEFTSTCISKPEISGICYECVIKFNNYDECIKSQLEIQNELKNLYLATLNYRNSSIYESKNEEEVTIHEGKNDEEVNIITINVIEDLGIKIENVEEAATDIMIYQSIDDIQTDNDEFTMPNLPSNVMESDIIDLNKLPKKVHASVKDESCQIFKSKSIQDGANDQFTLVHLSDNIVLYQCETCSRAFKEKAKLKVHRQIHTTERNVICSICDKKFKTTACLRAHRRIHQSVKFFCDHCDKGYTQKTDLVQHIRSWHLNTKDFECDICFTSFKSKSQLKSHKFIHNEIRPYKCNICESGFITKAKLARHMRSHSQVPEFACEICGKLFLYSYNVRAHVRTVHMKEKQKANQNSYKCSLCYEIFSKERELTKHLKKKHQIIVVNN